MIQKSWSVFHAIRTANSHTVTYDNVLWSFSVKFFCVFFLLLLSTFRLPNTHSLFLCIVKVKPCDTLINLFTQRTGYFNTTETISRDGSLEFMLLLYSICIFFSVFLRLYWVYSCHECIWIFECFHKWIFMCMYCMTNKRIGESFDRFKCWCVYWLHTCVYDMMFRMSFFVYSLTFE